MRAEDQGSEDSAALHSHPGEIVVADDSAPLAPGYDDGAVDQVGQHRAGEALELEGQVVELLLCQIVLPSLAVRQPLAQVHLCMRPG